MLEYDFKANNDLLASLFVAKDIQGWCFDRSIVCARNLVHKNDRYNYLKKSSSTNTLQHYFLYTVHFLYFNLEMVFMRRAVMVTAMLEAFFFYFNNIFWKR